MRTWFRYAAVAAFDATMVYASLVLFAERAWFLLVAGIIVTLLINWAYLSPIARASKWLTPGLIFLGLFVVWPIMYTVYVSLTNWATGTALTKEQVVEQLETVQVRLADGAVELDLAVYRDGDGDLAFLVSDETGTSYFGVARSRSDDPIEEPLLDLDEGITAGEAPDAIGGFELLGLRDLFAIADELSTLVLDIPNRGVATVSTPSAARLVASAQRFIYDPETDTLFDVERNVTCVDGFSTFVCDGEPLNEIRPETPGWREFVGTDNYERVLTNERIRQPFVGVFVWNVIFALGSVFFTFVIGLMLALALQDDRMKGKALFRSIFILPYAIPGFLSIIIWRGLLNEQFGQVNGFLSAFGIDAIPWLVDGTWAKIAILLVNIWLGFPYMFLITSGALQSVPAELQEAARVDGASAWRVFRSVTLPLLLVSTAPLLIGSFAFNFNNFVLVFLLTNGGPPLVNTAVPVGQTDLLITFTFDLAVRGGRGNNFALGSAIVIVIFIILAVISAISFRQTRRLEEIYGG